MKRFSPAFGHAPAPFLLVFALLAVAAATLAGALAFEHIGGLAPCPLCLQQRWPYWLGIPLGALALLALGRRHPRWCAGLMAVTALGFAAGSALAFYHAGMEWRWWSGPASCSGAAPPGNVAALLEGLRGTAPPRCDEAPWRLLGVSLSGYNALISALLAGLGLAAAMRCRSAQGPGAQGARRP